MAAIRFNKNGVACCILLTARGHVAEHVMDVGLGHADDTAIWNFALDRQAVILTKDKDFPLRLKQSKKAPVILWLRVANTSKRALLQWFEPLLPQIETLVQRGEALIEVR